MHRATTDAVWTHRRSACPVSYSRGSDVAVTRVVLGLKSGTVALLRDNTYRTVHSSPVDMVGNLVQNSVSQEVASWCKPPAAVWGGAKQTPAARTPLVYCLGSGAPPNNLIAPAGPLHGR